MNGNIRKMIRVGVETNLAILLNWEFLSQKEKEDLSFGQCWWVWAQTPTGSPEEAEAWQLVKAKAETLLHCQWIWENTPVDSPERAEAWQLLKNKAKAL